MFEKLFKKSVPVFLIAAALLGAIVASVIFLVSPSMRGLTANKAGEVAITFINENLLSGGMKAELLEIESNKASGSYKIKISIDGQEYTSYIAKDGSILYPEGYLIEEISELDGGAQSASEAPKTEKPDVKLFVMSYCPYGLQSQKALLPAYDLLKDKADIGVYFVDYIMHDKIEADENLVQYCIQEEQEDKFSDYLGCFVKEEGKGSACLTSAGVNTASLNSCVIKTDSEFSITETFNSSTAQFPPFNLHADLNDQYGVQGSPTLIINDTEITGVARTPEAYKKAICDAFIDAPEECSTELSDEAPSAGFGVGTGSSSDASCN
jgi:protein-disulfide isomerase